LLHNLKQGLHEHSVILTIETAQTPRVDPAGRGRMEAISDSPQRQPWAQSGTPLSQDHLFIATSWPANDATDYFQIPTGRGAEVGAQVAIQGMHAFFAWSDTKIELGYARSAGLYAALALLPCSEAI
jgi:KUP system potassium uptake protein